MVVKTEKKDRCGTVCLKYLLFMFNFLFWLAGGAVMAVGLWTLVKKSDYISLLSSRIYAASAYILCLAGVIVMVTGFLGCCATFKEKRQLLRVYFVLLLCIFLLEILAGVLAYIYYQQLSDELKNNLKNTMVNKYQQPEQNHITEAVDKLQQEFKCCGSNYSSDWNESIWVLTGQSNLRTVPDSCCKTPMDRCGERDHPSNIYKVEVGETFLLFLGFSGFLLKITFSEMCDSGVPLGFVQHGAAVVFRPANITNFFFLSFSLFLSFFSFIISFFLAFLFACRVPEHIVNLLISFDFSV